MSEDNSSDFEDLNPEDIGDIAVLFAEILTAMEGMIYQLHAENFILITKVQVLEIEVRDLKRKLK